MSRGANIEVRRVWLGLALCATTVVAASGCSGLRDFIVPPAENVKQGGKRARPLDMHLVVYDARLADGRKVAIGARDGRIALIADRATLALRVGASTATVEARGAHVTAGLTDAHVHLEGAALLQDAVDLRTVRTTAALQQALEARRGLIPVGGWVWGFGLQPALAAQLDVDALEKLAPELPVWLSTADGHGAQLSKTLLGQLPVTLRTRVAAAKGRVTESLARRAWYGLRPPAGEHLKPFVVRLLKRWALHGITSAHVMGARPELQVLLEELESAGRLPMRVRLYRAWPAPGTAAWLARLAEKRRVLARRSAAVAQSKSTKPVVAPLAASMPLVTVAGVKVWLDGTLGARTASLSQPYSDDTATHATPALTVQELTDAIQQVDAAGVQLAVHVIGDAALDRLLAAVRRAKRPADALPIRIEHAQVVRPDQIPQLKGFLCSVQPLHRLDDAPWAPARLGAARAGWAYRAASLSQRCPLLAGSDAPVGAVHPWRAMQAWTQHPVAAERVSASDALANFHRDPLTGRVAQLEVGEPADFVLWKVRPNAEAGAPPKRLGSVVAGVLRRVDPRVHGF